MIKRLALPIAVFAALLPTLLVEAPLRAQDGLGNNRPVNTSSEPERQVPVLGLDAVATPSLRILEEARRPETLHQVRIESRVVIRIAPSPPDDSRTRMLATQSRRAEPARYTEEPHGDCVAIEQIAGVASTQDNRLLLFMRDRDVLAASLERNCSARAFYSGFYVERNDDGRLCISRDRLQSRAGASCQLAEISRIVPAED